MTSPPLSPADRNGHPLGVVLIGTMLLAAAWLATPLLGPWLSNAAAAPLTIAAVVGIGPRPKMPNFRASWLMSAVALGVLFALLSWWLAPAVSERLPRVGEQVQMLYATLHRAPGPVWGVPILCLSALAEELIWRGVLVGWCESRWGNGLTVLASTVAYAIPMSASGSPLLVLLAIGLGAVLTIQRLHYHSWAPCCVTHLTWNLLVFVVHPVV